MTSTASQRARVAAPHGTGRLLARVRGDGRAVSLEEHAARYGLLPLGDDLIRTAAESGLSGRGGGGFPTGQKLRAVADRGGRPVVVVNGAEGEPASAKDRALMRCVPHLVLDGAAAAAAALGAHEIIIATARSARTEREVLTTAVRERRERVRWRLATVPDGFVVGEETALLAALSGRAARPTNKPPYPFERGLGGDPTLVQNSETLAQLALVARFGADWFRSQGTSQEPGTALVTLSGAVARPGIYEIEFGAHLSELVAQAGGATEPLAAFLVGGYFGTWTRDADLRLTAAAGLGAGVVVAFPTSTCALQESARVARYLAEQSAGQCGPCLHGLSALAGGLERIARGADDDREQLTRWAADVVGRGACRHPDGAARFVTSTLTTFEQETTRHLAHGHCDKRDRAILPTGPSRE